jgi:hypothetical protein
MRSVFVLALVVAFVGLSRIADRSAGKQYIHTGTVTEWQAGDFITVRRDQTDPQGSRISVRGAEYEGKTDTLKPGAFVVVWYRNIGEGRPVADRVRIIDPPTY